MNEQNASRHLLKRGGAVERIGDQILLRSKHVRGANDLLQFRNDAGGQSHNLSRDETANPHALQASMIFAGTGTLSGSGSSIDTLCGHARRNNPCDGLNTQAKTNKAAPTTTIAPAVEQSSHVER